MRPRPDAAENRQVGTQRRILTNDQGFNEAAARCRGKPEIDLLPLNGNRLKPRFNEAAARCRGKPRLYIAAGRPVHVRGLLQ